MGRNRRFRRDRRDRDDSDARQQSGSNQESGERRGYTLTERKNENFEKYYKAQNFIPEEEFEAFLDALKRPLPATFRITGGKNQSDQLLEMIEGQFFSDLANVEIEGRTIEPPKQLAWYPEGRAWQLDFERKLIRQNSTLKKLHNFLYSETESGAISRQEAVSMIPPLVLDIKPHHKVLDLCAAPGSKTAQLLELLHSGEDDGVPEGLVVANDADNKRCYLMMHQVKRLASPCFVITNHDAVQFPNFRLSPDGDKRDVLQFDRILADVPCSGDGTMRKNPDVWGKWNPATAHSLHGMQRNILKRGAEMLTVGGRVVYSTCSMNPIEDEAVVAYILEKCEGALELIDVSETLKELKYLPGVHKWQVMSRSGDFYSAFDELPENLRMQIRPEMFSPTPEVAEKLHLERCIRVLPQLQNTGGFFVAVMQKVKEVPWINARPRIYMEGDTIQKKEAEEKSTEKSAEKKDGETVEDETKAEVKSEEEKVENDAQPGEKRKREGEDARDDPRPKQKKKEHRGFKEDPFVYLKPDDPVIADIRSFYGLTEDFPVTQLLVRSHEGKKRNIYFMSRNLKQLIENNENRHKFINGGVKFLSRSDSQYSSTSFRLAQDGIDMLAPYISKRRVNVTRDDIVTILNQENPFLSKMQKATQTDLEALDTAGGQGGCLFVYRPDGAPKSPQCPLFLCGWKGRTSCRSFVPKYERSHYLTLCGEELKTKEDILAAKAATASNKDTAAAATAVTSEDVEKEGDDSPKTKEEDEDNDDGDNVEKEEEDSGDVPMDTDSTSKDVTLTKTEDLPVTAGNGTEEDKESDEKKDIVEHQKSESNNDSASDCTDAKKDTVSNEETAG